MALEWGWWRENTPPFFSQCSPVHTMLPSWEMLVTENPLAAFLLPLVGQIPSICCGQLQMVILAFPDGRSHCSSIPCVQCYSSPVWNENQAALGQSNHAPMGQGNAQLKVGLGLVLICFVIVLFPPYILCPIHTNHSQSWFFFLFISAFVIK